MALLAGHLDQISSCSKSIAQLEFAPPKIFTNALLGQHEITTLIRDTEPHERALFSIDSSVVKTSAQKSAIRQKGVESGGHGRKSLFPSAQPVKQSAITRLLGTEMLHEIKQSTSNTSRQHGGVNVEILLRGAERLCDVYAVAGVPEKIRSLRKRHSEVDASVSSLEDKVRKQQTLLERRNIGLAADEDASPHEADLEAANEGVASFTLDDLQAEEDEIRELELRKKALEDRVSGMERDLGGLR